MRQTETKEIIFVGVTIVLSLPLRIVLFSTSLLSKKNMKPRFCTFQASKIIRRVFWERLGRRLILENRNALPCHVLHFNKMKLFWMFENKSSVSFCTATLIPLDWAKKHAGTRPLQASCFCLMVNRVHIKCSSSAITTYHKNRHHRVTPEIHGPYNDGVVISGVEIIQVLISWRKQNLKGISVTWIHRENGQLTCCSAICRLRSSRARSCSVVVSTILFPPTNSLLSIICQRKK